MPEVRIPEFNPPKSGPRRLDWSALPEEARRRMVDSLREAGEQAMSAKSPGPQLDLEKLRGALRTLLDEVYEAMDEAMELAKRDDSIIWPFLYRIMSKRLVEVGEMPLSDPMGPGRMVPHSIKFYVGFAPPGYVGRALPGHGYVYYVDYDLLEAVASKGLSREGIEAWRAFVLQNMAHEMTHLVQAEFYPAAFSDYPEGGQTGPAYKAHPTEREARWASIDALLRMHGPTPEFWRTLSELFGDELRRSKDRVLALVEKYRNRILDASGSLMTADALARKLGLTEKAMRAFMDTMEPQRGRLETAASDLRRPEHARRILMLVAPKDFLEAEYEGPHTLFLERGMDVSVATGGKEALGTLGGKIATDLDVADAKADGFDALFVVGGKGMVGFSDDKGAQVLLRAFVDAGKPVALICHGPLLAAKAGLVKDRQVTGWPEIRPEMSAAGAKWTGMPVERDGDLFTAVGPEDAESLADILARRMDGAPTLSKAMLGEVAAMRKLAWLWRLADELDKPMTDEEAERWLQEFEREEFEEGEAEPAPPKPAPVAPAVKPTVRPAPAPVPAPAPAPEPSALGLEEPKWRQQEPKHEWNISIALHPPKTDGTWPEVPETPPPGFPFSADDLKDGPSIRELFQKRETWDALREVAANPAKRGLIQSYLLPMIVLALGRAWWNINKRHKQLGNAPFGLFSPEEYKTLQDSEIPMDETTTGRAWIALINWRVAKLLQSLLATGGPGPKQRFDGYIYDALNIEMVDDVGRRHGFEQKRIPVCSYCKFKRVIQTSPPFLSSTVKHKVEEEGSRKSRPLFRCPTCADLIDTKEQELRLKEQGVRNAEESLREMEERLADLQKQLAGDPDNAALKTRVESLLSMRDTYVPQVKALSQERDGLQDEIRNRRNMLSVPYLHIACINEDCPGHRVPLTAVDWESPFWQTPKGQEARRKLASFYGISETPMEQKAEDEPAGGEAIADRPGKKPPPWMWDVPFRCPFDNARFTPRQAFGRGRLTGDGRARLGGMFVNPPMGSKWVKPKSLEQQQMPEEEAQKQRVEEIRTQTGVDITTDSDQFLTDQNEKMYYEELASALRQEFYRRKQIHAERTKGLEGNRTAKLEALLYEALLEWSFVHPLHLVGYFTKRMPSLRKAIDKETGEVKPHLEIRSLSPGAAEQIVSSLIQTWFAKAMERKDAWMLLRKYLASETYDKVPPQGYFLSVARRNAEGELEAPCHLRYAKGSPIGDKSPRGTSYGRDIYVALVEGIWDYEGPHGEKELMTPIPLTQGDALVRGKASHLDEMEFHNSHKIVFDSATSLHEGSPILVKALFMPRHTAWVPIKRVMHLRKDLADPEDDMAGIMDIVGRLADNREEDVKMFARWRKALRQLGMPGQVEKFDKELRKRLEEKGMKHSEASLLAEAKDPLAKYKGKRKFDETPEPEGKEERGGNKHRFVIQLHHAKKAGDHYDLRLENDDGALSSWSVPKHRLPKGKEKLLAVKTEDHPVEYLKFKGDIPAGEYGAGTMEIHDSGTYEEIEASKTKIVFRLKGKKEKGTYRLFRAGEGKQWMIMEGSGGKKASGAPPLSRRADKVSRKVKPLLREPVPGQRMWEGIWEKHEDPVKHMREDRPTFILPHNIPDWAVAAEGLERPQDLPSGEGLEPSDPNGRYYVTDMDDNIVARYDTKEKAIRNAEGSKWTSRVFHSEHDDPWDVFVYMEKDDKPVVWERPPEQFRRMRAETRARKGPYYLMDYWGRTLASYDDLDQAVRNAEGSMYVSQIVFSMVDDPDNGKVVWTKPAPAGVRSSATPALSKRAAFTFRPHPPSHKPGEWVDYKLPPGAGTPLPIPKSEEELWREQEQKRREREERAHVVEKPETPKKIEPLRPKVRIEDLPNTWWLLYLGPYALGWYRDPGDAGEVRNDLIYDFSESGTGLIGDMLEDEARRARGRPTDRLLQLMYSASQNKKDLRDFIGQDLTGVIAARAPGWEPDPSTVLGPDEKPSSYDAFEHSIRLHGIPDDAKEFWNLRKVKRIIKNLIDYGDDLIANPDDVLKVAENRPPLSRRAALERLPIAADPAMWTDEQLVEAVARPELFGNDKAKYQAAVEQLAKRGLAKKMEPKDVGHWLEHGRFMLFWGGSPLAIYRTREHAQRSKGALVKDFVEQGKFPDFVDGGQQGWEGLIRGDISYHASRSVGDSRAAPPLAKREVIERLLNPKTNGKDRKEYAESALNIVKLPATLNVPDKDCANGDRPEPKDSIVARDVFSGTLQTEPTNEDDPYDEDAGDISSESRENERAGRQEFIEQAVKTVRKRLDAQKAGLDPEKLADDDALELALIEQEELPLSRRAAVGMACPHCYADVSKLEPEQTPAGLYKMMTCPECKGSFYPQDAMVAAKEPGKRELDMGEWPERGWFLLMVGHKPMGFAEGEGAANAALGRWREMAAKGDWGDVNLDSIANRALSKVEDMLRDPFGKPSLGGRTLWELARRQGIGLDKRLDELMRHPMYEKTRRELAGRIGNLVPMPPGFKPAPESRIAGFPTDENAESADVQIDSLLGHLDDIDDAHKKPGQRRFEGALADAQAKANDAFNGMAKEMAKPVAKRLKWLLEQEGKIPKPEEMADDFPISKRMETYQ